MPSSFRGALPKYHGPGGLYTAEIYCSQFWRLDDQGASTVEWGPLLTWRLLASSHSGRLDAHLSDILKPLKSDCVFKWIAFYYCCQSGGRVDIARVCTNCSELLVLSSCLPTYSIMKRKKFSGTGFSVAKWTHYKWPEAHTLSPSENRELHS